MDCRKYRAMISREIDGEAAEIEISALSRHAASCPSCASFREISRRATAIHRAQPERSPSPRLVEEICALARVQRESHRPGGWLRFAIPAAAAAVFVLGFWIGSLMHESYLGGGAEVVAERTEGLGLEYLDEYPPGSFGRVLAVSDEGGAK